MQFFSNDWNIHPLVGSLILIAAAVLMALALHWIAVRILCRVVSNSKTPIDDPFVSRARLPLRWLMIALALAFVRPSLVLGERGHAIWEQAAAIIVPGLLGWLVVAMIRATEDVVTLRADISVEDNLRARRKRTRTTILSKIATLAAIFITLCLMLFSIPAVRAVGVTLMASAGLAALAVGAAAQPLLKNVIAGIQLAFTEPIRLDDVVIIEGEWGKIEEIHLTFVVVAIWDERRLVVPVSKFLEDSFQNWTRSSSRLLGAIYWRLDPAADIERIRARYEELVKASKLWDGRAFVLQVTETGEETIEVRGLATAKDAGAAFDLRCELREKLLAYISAEMPEALPRRRQMVVQGAGVERFSPAAAREEG
jgi:small-conductance mechanosensitive channel